MIEQVVIDLNPVVNAIMIAFSVGFVLMLYILYNLTGRQ